MSNKPCLRLLCLAVLLLGAGSAVLWWPRAESDLPATHYPLPATPLSGIVTTAHNSHQSIDSYSTAGDIRTPAALAALTDALSLTSRLPYAQRLAAVHAMGRVSSASDSPPLASRPLSPDQAAFLRAFVADRAIPEGLNIRQVRALKNDILNVLSLIPGEETTTAATLHALYADETADPGLRDYALQHLASLNERDPNIGWSSHLHAIEGNNPALAATALIHLAAQLRGSSDLLTTRYSLPATPSALPATPSASDLPATRYPLLATISASALRLASDPTAPDPARTTAVQICGQLKLTEARDLANDLARSERAGMPLRIAAIATLGDLGDDTATRDYLAALATGPEKRLRIPAQSALKRLSIN